MPETVAAWTLLIYKPVNRFYEPAQTTQGTTTDKEKRKAKINKTFRRRVLIDMPFFAHFPLFNLLK